MAMINTHVLNRGPAGIRSPLDGIGTHSRRWCYPDPYKMPQEMVPWAQLIETTTKMACCSENSMAC